MNEWHEAVKRAKEKQKQALKRSSDKEWRAAVADQTKWASPPVRYILRPENEPYLPSPVRKLLKGIDFGAAPQALLRSVDKRLMKSRTVGVATLMGQLVVLTLPEESKIRVSADSISSSQMRLAKERTQTALFGGKILIDWPLPETVLAEMAVYAIKDRWEGKLLVKTMKRLLGEEPGAVPYLLEVSRQGSPHILDHISSEAPEWELAELFAGKPCELGGEMSFGYALIDSGSRSDWVSDAVFGGKQFKHLKETLLPPLDEDHMYVSMSSVRKGNVPAEIMMILEDDDWQPFRIVEFVFGRPLTNEEDYRDLLRAHTAIKEALEAQGDLQVKLIEYLSKKCTALGYPELVGLVFERLKTRYGFPMSRERLPSSFSKFPATGLDAYVAKTIREEAKATFADRKNANEAMASFSLLEEHSEVTMVGRVGKEEGALQSDIPTERQTKRSVLTRDVVKRWTVREAARDIGCSRDWIYKMVSEGKFAPRGHEGSGQIVLSEDELEDLGKTFQQKNLRATLVKMMVSAGLSGERAVRRWIKRRTDKGVPIEEVAKEAAKRLKNGQREER